MGCDIHCYIEYKKPEWDSWSNFGGRINPGRNYHLFAKLAGVRNYDEITDFIQPRGIPEDAAYASATDNQLYVSDIEQDGNCTRDRAEMWVASGCSKYTDDRKMFVTNPDWHSHSWLDVNEFGGAIEGTGRVEYSVILEAMRAFEDMGYTSRLVFWFDN